MQNQYIINIIIYYYNYFEYIQTGTTTFPIQEEDDPAVPVFPIPYDVPLSRYRSSDRPFVTEFLDSLE